MTDKSLIEDFLKARGVTKVAPGVRTMSEREMYGAVRGELVRDDKTRPVRCIIGHDGKEHWLNGYGEWLS